MDFKPLLKEMNRLASTELNPKKWKFICSNKRHWSNLLTTKIGDECICKGVWELNK